MIWETGERSHEPTQVVGVKDVPPLHHVVAYDFGIKHNILRMLRVRRMQSDGGSGARHRLKTCWR